MQSRHILTVSGPLMLMLLFVGCGPADTGGKKPEPDSKVEIDQPLSEFEVPTPEPSSSDPASFGMGIDPGSTSRGSLVTVAIRARIATGWHIYAVDKPTDPAKPTQLTLKLPQGIIEVGEWDIPEPHEKGNIFQYDGEVVFRRFIRVQEDAVPGLYDLECKVAHQPCQDDRCLRPTSKTVSVALEVTE